MKSKYMNNGGQKALGQLGNQKQHRFDAPPREYMPQQPLNQLGFKQPKAYKSDRPDPIQLGNLHKEQRRQEWLKKKRAKRRGLSNLNEGNVIWN